MEGSFVGEKNMALPMLKRFRLPLGSVFHISSRSFFTVHIRSERIVQKRHRLKIHRELSQHSKKGKEKIHINVGTIGHVDHGKTTLTSAITRALSEEGSSRFIEYDQIDRAPEERLRGITINATHIEYSTATRHYAHTDCPGHRDFIKNMICGTSQMDGAIVVVAADDGCMPQTREHLLICKQLGVEKIIGFVNKADLGDQDVLDLIQLEIRDLLEDFKFECTKDAPIIYGSALKAMEGDTSEFGLPSIRKLLAEMDSYFVPPKRDTDGPLMAPLEGALNVKGRGTVLIGTLFRGTLKRGDHVEIVGFDQKIPTVVTEIQMFGKTIPECKAGDHVGLLVRGIKTNIIERGMTLISPNSAATSNRFRAQLYLLAKGEGGRSRPISQKYIMPMFSRTWNIACRVDVASDSMLMPGDHADVFLTLPKKMLMTVGQSFTIREHNRTVATGLISEVLPSILVTTSQIGMVAVGN
ncbi:elongation factor Tu-like [Ornithodoros turicata]|uniref:elongation factor Tu-like n=1 Tax=Ornithodoros turicata TaxID=34597 RepID=UPI003139F2DE